MEIEYKRDINKSYMCILTEEQFSEFEKNMMEKNVIPGLLPVRMAAKEENYAFWYDITGKQDLEGIVDAKYLDYELLTQFFAGLCSVLEQMESYLLNPGQLLLRQDTIFKDRKENTFVFCYCADTKTEMTDAFETLMEWLLTKVNHKDEAAVKMAYSVYEQVEKGEYSLAAIREELHFVQEVKEPQEAVQSEVEQPEEAGGMVTEGLQPEKQTICFPKILERLLNHFFPDFERIRQYRAEKRKKAEVQPIVFEPEEEREQQSPVRPTVLLANAQKKLSGVLIYEGTQCFANITIDKTPYVIGSAADCDGQIDSPTISRHHAKITRKEELYFIEDLNSANGTSVGGKLLDYKIRVSLQVNEIVEFADIKFRFI